MFDSLYDVDGNEWQTKAYHNLLDNYLIGDRITAGPPFTYQVKVLGGDEPPFTYSHATIRDGVLAAVPADRDPNLPLLDYHGGWLPAEEGA